MKHLLDKNEVLKQRLNAIHEQVFKMGDVYKVRTNIEIPRTLINKFVSKAKKEHEVDPKENWSDIELAQLFVDYVLANYLNDESLPVEGILGKQEKTPGAIEGTVDAGEEFEETDEQILDTVDTVETPIETFDDEISSEIQFEGKVNESEFTRAIEYANTFIKDHPEHKGEVFDFFQLMKDEVEEGGSINNEIEHFISACDDLLMNEKKSYEPVLEFFGLGNKIKNAFSKAIGGNIGKIDNSLNKYKDAYEKLLEETQTVINKLDDKDNEEIKGKLTQLSSALSKKRSIIQKQLNLELKQITINDREKTYAEVQKNSIELELIEKEINMLTELNVDTEMTDKLEKLKNDTQDKFKQGTKQLKELTKVNKQNTNNKTKDDAQTKFKEGEKIEYELKDGGTATNVVVKDNNDSVIIKNKEGKEFTISKDKIITSKK